MKEIYDWAADSGLLRQVLAAVLLAAMIMGLCAGCAAPASMAGSSGQGSGKQLETDGSAFSRDEPQDAWVAEHEPEGPKDTRLSQDHSAQNEPAQTSGAQEGPEQGQPQASESKSVEEAKQPQEPAAASGEYDYSKPVPECEAVDESYFDDAVFIGDSRTEGFALYSGLKDIHSLTYVGLMVDTVFTKKVIYQSDGSKVAVMDALKNMDFSKVYLMLGVNELGWVYSSVFKEYYGRIIDRIREINPDAVIYVQSILPVSAAKNSGDPVYNNTRIGEYNGLLKDLAQEKQVYYVNVAEAVSDESGCLPEGASFDGVHLVPEYCKTWLDYLKRHVVE